MADCVSLGDELMKLKLGVRVFGTFCFYHVLQLGPKKLAQAVRLDAFIYELHCHTATAPPPLLWLVTWCFL